jgi:type I restriction-modification system DNA methylase subunit
LQASLEHLAYTITNVFGSEFRPYENIVLPDYAASKKASNQTFRVAKLWTKNTLRPHWGNLAVVASEIPQTKDNWWKEFVTRLSIPIAVAVDNEVYRVITNKSSVETLTPEQLPQYLRDENHRAQLFTPRGLGQIRTGQLSFADLEDTLDEQSFTYHLRYRTTLEDALNDAINEAVQAQFNEVKIESVQDKAAITTSIKTVAFAYLAARILDDKGFFDGKHLLENDPRELLAKTLERTNGFFKKAYDNDINSLSDVALQQLARFLGNSVTFALVDHWDVGRLYEKAVSTIAQQQDLKLKLGQHYTPIAIADRMLQALPLERLKPQERIIFDPAAGSGSLLLAATKRLALMEDVAQLPNLQEYLSNHVLGNDLDANARLITQLRYTLVQETLGKQELFPTPKFFGKTNYEQPDTWDALPDRPRVIIANPPYAEEGATNLAARFVQKSLEHLQEGAQFAFVLPQTFLSASTHGWQEARQLLFEKTKVFEIWQLPEGSIGLSAEQATCIIVGVISREPLKITISRKIVSRRARKDIKNKGFLGPAWLINNDECSENFELLKAPKIAIPLPTMRLGNLYHVCAGVTLKKGVLPIGQTPENIPVKPYWKSSWKTPESIWINQKRIPPEEKFIKYVTEFFHQNNMGDEEVYDSQKVLVNRSINQDSKNLLSPCIDTVGFCPSVHIFCLIPWDSISLRKDTPSNVEVPEGWFDLSEYQKLLWLTGLLSSDLVNQLSLTNRSPRHITSDNLKELSLPSKIDKRIIELTDSIVQIEMKPDFLVDSIGTIKQKQKKKSVQINPLYRDELETIKNQLNQAVEASYGNPFYTATVRTGLPPELKEWQEELKEPTITVAGQVLELDADSNKVLLYLNGLLDDIYEDWIPLPQELPGWALDSTVFEAELSKSVETFEDLKKRPWALRKFKHTPLPYISLEELEAHLLLRLGAEL